MKLSSISPTLNEVQLDYVPVGFNTENAPRVLVVAAAKRL